MKKFLIIVAAIVTALTLMTVGCGALIATSSDVESGGEGPSKGVASQDANADVKVLSFQATGGALISCSATVEITNHSSKRSDYYIEGNVQNSQGVNVGMANTYVTNVEPNAKALSELNCIGAEDGTKFVITEVQRTASV